VSRFQFAAQAPIFGFKCFFGYGCFCFHFLHLYMFFAIGLLAFVSRRRCQRLCPFSFQHDRKRVSREKAQKKILQSFLIKKMYVQSWFSFTCTKFFFRPLTPFLYRATLIRAQAPSAKFSSQQQKRRSRFSKKIVSFRRGVIGREQTQPLRFLRSQTRSDARFDDGNRQH
jgi:hypothetical protein